MLVIIDVKNVISLKDRMVLKMRINLVVHQRDEPGVEVGGGGGSESQVTGELGLLLRQPPALWT